MGTITVTEFVSMDGVMQAPGGEKFKYEGWTFEFDRGADGGKFKGEELFDAEAASIAECVMNGRSRTARCLMSL